LGIKKAKSSKKTASKKNIDVVNLILGLVAIISGILISIFENDYLQGIMIALGIFFVALVHITLVRSNMFKKLH